MPHNHHALAQEMTTAEAASEVPTDSSVLPTKAGGPLGAVWNAVTAVIATLMGLAPHVLHHIGLFAGAAFVVGVGGNLLFGTWKAPAVAVAVFTVMFSISAFVIGPAISGTDPADAPQPAGTPSSPAEHSAHHTD